MGSISKENEDDLITNNQLEEARGGRKKPPCIFHLPPVKDEGKRKCYGPEYGLMQHTPGS